MNKLHLGKSLVESFPENIDIVDGDYEINKNDYARICRKLNNNIYYDIPNYYLEAYKLEYYKDSPSQTYSQKLNQILWDFLLFNEGSCADLKILDKAIDIDNKMNNTISGIEKSEDVLKYMKSVGYDTYLKFTQYLNNLYGIDTKEYYDFMVNQHNSKEEIINKTNTYKMIISAIKENEEVVFDGNDMVDRKLLRERMREYVAVPVYVQKYSRPMLKILKLKKVVFEFNMLDDKKDITKQLDEIYSREKSYKRVMSSSNKQEFLDIYFPKENKDCIEKKDRLDSILGIKKAFIIYQYSQHCQDLEEARLIYNFHILLSNVGKRESDDYAIYMENDDLITKHYLKKEIRIQLKIITSMLNLKNH